MSAFICRGPSHGIDSAVVRACLDALDGGRRTSASSLQNKGSIGPDLRAAKTGLARNSWLWRVPEISRRVNYAPLSDGEVISCLCMERVSVECETSQGPRGCGCSGGQRTNTGIRDVVLRCRRVGDRRTPEAPALSEGSRDCIASFIVFVCGEFRYRIRRGGRDPQETNSLEAWKARGLSHCPLGESEDA